MGNLWVCNTQLTSRKVGSVSQVVRSQNFNERIGRVRAADVALLVGEGTSLEPITLESWLMLVVN